MSPEPSKLNQVVIDPWSYMTHKGRFSDSANSKAWAAPGWIADLQDRRRVQAYILLASYSHNMARHWLNLPPDKEYQRDKHREYGDANLLIEQIVASVLGKGHGIMIEGAQEPIEDRTEAQGDEPPTPSPEWVQLQALKDWADKELWDEKVLENEHQQCELGDSVMVLGWDSKKQRCRVQVYDPGFYFPVWSDDGSDSEGFDEEFPRKVHIAYEFQRKVKDTYESFVRRITWELAPKEDNPDGPDTCWMSDGTWRLRHLRGSEQDIYDLSPEKADWRMFEEDIGIDFIPVVHFPNTPPGKNLWGTSSVATVLQILDDLSANDTDIQKAGAIAGTPPLALQGATAPVNSDGTISSYGPGTVWQTGDGKLSALEVADGLRALLETKNELLERLSINSMVPESMLGRIKPSDVPSGIALWLSFGPHSGMIDRMRLVRDNKYKIVLRFVLRFMQQNGQIEGELFQPKMHFGSYLPADKKEAMDMVVSALNAKVNPMSLETAVTTLMQAGFDIDDAQAEVRKIEKRMYDDALALAQVTGDLNMARRLLGYEDAVVVGPADIGNGTEDEPTFGQ